MIEQQCTVRHRHNIYCLLHGDQPTLLNGSYHHELLLSVCHNSSNDLMIGYALTKINILNQSDTIRTLYRMLNYIT
jgi:hypothetical protein